MLAIQSPRLKLAAVYRSFETIRLRKQQWRFVRLDDSYLDLSNDIYQDRNFIRGVIKIQNRSFQNFSHEERDAVKMLVTQRTNTIDEEDADDDE